MWKKAVAELDFCGSLAGGMGIQNAPELNFFA